MSDRPPPERALLTFALLGANLLAFAACGLLAGTIPFNVPTGVLIGLGANVAPFTQHAGHWENLCTATFLHGGVVHILFNLVALYQVGPFVERTLGRARYAMLYVLSGLGASLFTTLGVRYGLSDAAVAVGASGAICGLIGGAAVLGFRIEGRSSPLARSMLRWLGFTMVFGYVVSKGGGVSIDNHAHLGGALTGAAVAMSFRRAVSYSALGRTMRVAACVLVCVSAFVVKLLRPEPAWTEAKIHCLIGRDDAMRAELAALHVGAKDVELVSAECKRRPKER